MDDCSTSGNNYNSTSPPSTIRVSLTFTTTLTAERARYVTSDYAGAGEYITGIDDDDEWTPNRLSVFLAHKQQLVTNAFCTLTTTFAVAKSIPNRQVCRCIPNRRIHAACFTNAISLAIRSLPGVAFQRVLVRYRTESGTGLRHLPADGGGVRRTVESRRGDADPAYQSRRNADHLVTEKFSGYFHFYRKHKDKFDRASKKYQLFTLYQIRNKRMTGALC